MDETLAFAFMKVPSTATRSPPEKTRLAAGDDELRLHLLQRLEIALPEFGDRHVARAAAAAQPHQLHVAPHLGFKPPGASDALLAAVQVQLQQHPRIVGRLPGAAVRAGVLKSQPVQIQGAGPKIDRAHRVVRADVVVQAVRQQDALAAVGAWCATSRAHGIHHSLKLIGIDAHYIVFK